MKLFFSDRQMAHRPTQYMINGRIGSALENPERAQTLVGSLTALGLTLEEPKDAGRAPIEAVHHVGGLLPNSPDVRLETAPGGHLGVLTGRTAVRSTWIFLDEFLAAYDAARRPAPAGRPEQRRTARPVSA